MANIGADIFNGILGAMWHALLFVPWQIWLGLVVLVVVAIAVLRLVTNPHVSLPAIALAALVIMLLAFRAHFIAEGYNEALDKVKAADARVKAYEKTNGLIEACYARNTSASFLWDRTQGKCLRADGAIE
jgi:hypothetical protein